MTRESKGSRSLSGERKRTRDRAVWLDQGLKGHAVLENKSEDTGL